MSILMSEQTLKVKKIVQKEEKNRVFSRPSNILFITYTARTLPFALVHVYFRGYVVHL